MNKVPNLRFKEFSEDWMCEKIGNITSLVKDGSHGTHQDVKKGSYLLSAKNIKNGKVVIEDDDRKISEEEYNAIYKNYSLEVGDILLSIVGTIGRVAIVNEIQPIAFQRSVAILRFNKMNSKFIECCINNRGFQNDLLKYQVVSVQPGIYLNDLKKLKINFPELEEQEKIASFFSLIDKKIELQTEKVEELKNYKKGIMQKIFSQEIRFKDDNGNDYPKWEEKKLRECLIPRVQKQLPSKYGQYRIHADDFLNVSVCIPSYKEQEKFASFLYLIDKKIEKEQEKLEYLKQYKKGLLQQMFI